MIKYIIILFLLILIELLYFRLADRFNIIDKPNQRSSHSQIVLRGGGIIFLLGVWIWAAFFGFQYPLLLAAVTLAAGISFVDDIHSLPDSVRLVVHFVAMALLIVQVYLSARGGVLMQGISVPAMVLFFIVALVVCVGATNIFNFMDGINGILACYSMAVLVPLMMVDIKIYGVAGAEPVPHTLLIVTAIAVIVFSFFNFRPRGRAKCFAGDVGSVGIAFILLFCIGMLVAATGDITWLTFLIVFGVDGCLTICHRIMLHENLGQAHRKHAYQIMANELGMSHVAVSLIYMTLQLAISLVLVFIIPNTPAAHWIYLTAVLILLSIAYVLFMKKYYHLHEEWLNEVK